MTAGWTAEWRTGLRRRRLLALNVAVPLLFVASLVLGGAPTAHAAAALAVLFTVFGVFGSAIPLVRDGEDGLLLRWLLAGVEPRGWLAGRLAAQTALDLLALLPSVALLAFAGANPGGSPGAGGRFAVALILLAALVVALLVANVLGAWVAAAARSLAEAALFGAVAALLLLHLAGVFRTPVAETWQAAAEAAVPFRLLHDALLGALAGGLAGGPVGAATHGGTLWTGMPALAVTGGVLLLTWMGASRLLGRLSAPEGGPV